MTPPARTLEAIDAELAKLDQALALTAPRNALQNVVRLAWGSPPQPRRCATRSKLRRALSTRSPQRERQSCGRARRSSPRAITELEGAPAPPVHVVEPRVLAELRDKAARLDHVLASFHVEEAA